QPLEETAMSTQTPIEALRRGLLATMRCRSREEPTVRFWRWFAVAGLLLLPLSGAAMAQTIGTCNGFINLEYTSLVDPAFPACISPDPTQHCTANQMTGQCECCLDAGSTVTVKTQLGAGDILFGTQMMVDATAFDPDCQPFVTPVCLARPGGPRIAWISDTTIKTTCLGVTISTGIAD